VSRAAAAGVGERGRKWAESVTCSVRRGGGGVGGGGVDACAGEAGGARPGGEHYLCIGTRISKFMYRY
jgi:hypothetical protein